MSGHNKGKHNKNDNKKKKHHQNNDYDDEYEPRQHVPFLPPGADVVSSNRPRFGDSFDPSFGVPNRLRDKPSDLVEAVNDFHYAMINDFPRNEFYKKCLQAVVNEESMVLEIGTGTGLLSMLAAQLGAKWVIAIEANSDLAALARQNIAANNLQNKITVLNQLSTDVTAAQLPEKPNVLVSELFGTLLLGESAHTYIHDARERLLKPNPSVVPRFGSQYASLIECDELDRITSVKGWGGFELSKLNSLKDTASVVFTKMYGFRLNTAKYNELADPLSILDVDFATVDSDRMEVEKRFNIIVKKSGVVHAVLLHWEAYSDKEKTEVISTHPEATRDNFPRDMQWGQALQLIEDGQQTLVQEAPNAQKIEVPSPFVVTEGEVLEATIRFSGDGVLLQCELRHA